MRSKKYYEIILLSGSILSIVASVILASYAEILNATLLVSYLIVLTLVLIYYILVIKEKEAMRDDD